MYLPRCGVNTFLYISSVLVFGCSRCKLVDFLVMSIVQLTWVFGPIHCKFNSWAFQVTHIFCHLCIRFCTMQNFFYAFSDFLFFSFFFFFFILLTSFPIYPASILFLNLSRMWVLTIFFEGGVCLERFPIVLWLFILFVCYLFIYISIYFYLTGRSSITEFIFWRIYPVWIWLTIIIIIIIIIIKAPRPGNTGLMSSGR